MQNQSKPPTITGLFRPHSLVCKSLLFCLIYLFLTSAWLHSHCSPWCPIHKRLHYFPQCVGARHLSCNCFLPFTWWILFRIIYTFSFDTKRHTPYFLLFGATAQSLRCRSRTVYYTKLHYILTSMSSFLLFWCTNWHLVHNPSFTILSVCIRWPTKFACTPTLIHTSSLLSTAP